MHSSWRAKAATQGVRGHSKERREVTTQTACMQRHTRPWPQPCTGRPTGARAQARAQPSAPHTCLPVHSGRGFRIAGMGTTPSQSSMVIRMLIMRSFSINASRLLISLKGGRGTVVGQSHSSMTAGHLHAAQSMLRRRVRACVADLCLQDAIMLPDLFENSNPTPMGSLSSTRGFSGQPAWHDQPGWLWRRGGWLLQGDAASFLTVL